MVDARPSVTLAELEVALAGLRARFRCKKVAGANYDLSQRTGVAAITMEFYDPVTHRPLTPMRLHLVGAVLPRIQKFMFFGLHRVHGHVCCA